ncbi:nuclease-related domain-containing protein [Thalassobacillus sp. C254]|uniref:nuclease-related domain-containing protein n=1 Tax=Thalassobacillus sp. C254 TaxID=1225341 RepID=UPI0006D26B9D|nr:nuclease-related domain-containing protein [Thalassobacillus sp. C254]
MIVKPRLIPRYLQQLEALLRRLPENHPKREAISEDLAKRRAGYQGEKNIDYPLSFLPEKEYHIFHDLRLFDGSHHFQIDTLIVSPRFILILEVKNITGTLFFDSAFNQLIRTRDGKEEAFPDPLIQVERQSLQLKKWLKNNNYVNMPVSELVVIGSPRTLLKTAPGNQYIYNKVILAPKLPQEITKLEKTFPTKVIHSKRFLKLSSLLIDHHCPLHVNVLKRYEITDKEVLKGVCCPQCNYVPMTRARGKWMCFQCLHTSKDCYKETLHDYSLLINSTITNKKAREFLLVSSQTVMKSLLANANLSHSGATKGTLYHLE